MTAKTTNYIQKFFAALVLLNLIGVTVLLFRQPIVAVIDDFLKPSHLQQVIQRQELRVGVLPTFVSRYVDSANFHQINDLQEQVLLGDFADSLKVKLKLVQAENKEALFQLLQQGKIDLIASDLFGTQLHQQQLLNSLPYAFTSQQIVYLKGSLKPRSLDNIQGKLVVLEDSVQEAILQHLQQDHPNLQWQTVTNLNQEALLKQLAQKKFNYTIADSSTVLLMQHLYPLLTPAMTVVSKQPLCWYFLKNGDISLLEKANRFIETAATRGAVENLLFRSPYTMHTFNYIDSRAFLRAVDNQLDNYLPLFKKYAKKQRLDWRLVAAVAYQESHWNPNAVSATGVQGMMMLTQATSQTFGVTDRFDAEQSIAGGAAYIRMLLDKMPHTIPQSERIWFALAAYNMGYAHLLDAQDLARKLHKDPNSWRDIDEILPLLNDATYYQKLPHGAAQGGQARYYVRGIQHYYFSLIAHLAEQSSQHK